METDEDLNTWIVLFQVEAASEQVSSVTDVVQSSSLCDEEVGGWRLLEAPG